MKEEKLREERKFYKGHLVNAYYPILCMSREGIAHQGVFPSAERLDFGRQRIFVNDSGGGS